MWKWSKRDHYVSQKHWYDKGIPVPRGCIVTSELLYLMQNVLVLGFDKKQKQNKTRLQNKTKQNNTVSSTVHVGNYRMLWVTKFLVVGLCRLISIHLL